MSFPAIAPACPLAAVPPVDSTMASNAVGYFVCREAGLRTRAPQVDAEVPEVPQPRRVVGVQDCGAPRRSHPGGVRVLAAQQLSGSDRSSGRVLRAAGPHRGMVAAPRTGSVSAQSRCGRAHGCTRGPQTATADAADRTVAGAAGRVTVR